MYKRILVTLDGSPLSEQVLPQVKQLIAGAETSITLLTVAAAPEESTSQTPELPVRCSDDLRTPAGPVVGRWPASLASAAGAVSRS